MRDPRAASDVRHCRHGPAEIGALDCGIARQFYCGTIAGIAAVLDDVPAIGDRQALPRILLDEQNRWA